MKQHTLWTALITPMTNTGEIAFDDLTTLLRRQEATGNGVLILGSTGEGLALTPDEHRAVVEHTCSLNLSVEIMVGIGGYQLPQQKAMIEFCNSLPVSAYLLVVPLYAKPEAVGQTKWFEALLNASTKPCMLYNVPSRTGVQLAEETLSAVANHPHCWALKEASGDLTRYQRYHELAPNIQLFSGEDAMVAEMAKISCHGLVSVISNSWPEATAHYVTKALAGELTSSEQALFDEATAASFAVSNPVPTKCWLASRGIIASAHARPPLASDALTSLEQLSHVHEQIQHFCEGVTA